MSDNQSFSSIQYPYDPNPDTAAYLVENIAAFTAIETASYRLPPTSKKEEKNAQIVFFCTFKLCMRYISFVSAVPIKLSFLSIRLYLLKRLYVHHIRTWLLAREG